MFEQYWKNSTIFLVIISSLEKCCYVMHKYKSKAALSSTGKERTREALIVYQQAQALLDTHWASLLWWCIDYWCACIYIKRAHMYKSLKYKSWLIRSKTWLISDAIMRFLLYIVLYMSTWRSSFAIRVLSIDLYIYIGSKGGGATHNCEIWPWESPSHS